MAAPPKPPPKPGSLRAANQTPEELERAARHATDQLTEEARGLEEELESLKAKYEQYFLGLERREPVRWREEMKKKVNRIKTAFTRNTGLKFKIQSIHARYISYERLWLRGAREKEEGTYRRDVFKAKLHARAAAAKEPAAGAGDGEGATAGAAPGPKAPPLAPVKPGGPPAAATGAAGAVADAPPVSPPPVRPIAASAAPVTAAAAASRPPPASAAPRPAAPAAPAPRAPAPAGPPQAVDPQLRALYDAYIAAKRSCNEDVSRITYDAVARSVQKQVPELMARYKAKAVDFKVEVKDGKAVLKAIPRV